MDIAELWAVLGFKTKPETVANVNKTINSIKSTAMKALGAIGIGFSLSAINSTIEAFSDVNDAIRASISETDNLEAAERAVLNAANECNVTYEEMAGTVTKIAQSNSELFPIEDAANFTGLVQKLGVSYGYTGNAISNMQSQLTKAIASGALGASQLQQLQTTAPALVKTLADGLGVTNDELTAMAANGQLTAQVIKDGMLKSADEINKKYSSMSLKISDAITRIRNKWGFFLAETDEMTGITNRVSTLMVRGFDRFMNVLTKVRTGVMNLAEKLGGMDNLLKLLLIVAGSLYFSFKLPMIIEGITKIIGLIKQTTALLSGKGALVAGLVLIGLLVDDLVNFMKGNDSLMGSAFEAAGISADEMRQKILDTWENIKTFFDGVWKSIQENLEPVIENVKKLLEDIFGEDLFAGLGEGIAGVIEFINRLSEALANNKGLQDFVGTILTAIPIFLIAKTAITGLIGVISFLASPVGLAIAAITLLIAAFIFLRNHLDDIKAWFHKIFDAIKSKVTDVLNSISEFIKNVIEGIKTTWENVWTAVGDFFTEIWTAISDFFTEIWNTIVETITTVLTSIWEFITETWNGIWETIVSILSAIWGFIVEAWNGIWSTIVGFLASIWASVSETWNSIWTTIVTFVTNIWNDVSSWFQQIYDTISQKVQDAKQAIIDGFNAAVEFVKSLPAQAVQWGSDLISNFISGLTAKWDALRQKVSGIASTIAGFLHFSEPDEGPLANFHTFAPDMMNLFMKGIDDNRPKLISTLENMTGDMAALLSGGAPLPATVSMASGSYGSGSRSIVQNVTINNKFEGDRAIQKHASDAMDKSAEDVTSKLARGLQSLK